MALTKPDFFKIKDELKLFFLPCEQNGGRAKIFAGNFLPRFIIAIALLKLIYAAFLYYFPNNQFFADITKTALVQLTNAERAKNNLPKLVPNQTLDQAAYLKAQDMAKNSYFSHISPNGVSPWHWFSQAGYNYKYAGENLAIGFLDSSEIQNAWTASPTHKANIVNDKYKEIGIAVLKTEFKGNPATIVVQLFGAEAAQSKNMPDIKTLGKFQPDIQKNSLAQAQKKAVLGASTKNLDKSSFSYKIAQFFSQNFFGLIQFIVYGALIFMIGLLAVNFVLRPDFEHVDILAKAIGFVAIMLIFSLLDNGAIAAMLPRDMFIQ